ncbi:MAG: hypothetical protein ABSB74_05785 [Tepidisphaeraceae bacterium]|jgi:hypothetical protein
MTYKFLYLASGWNNLLQATAKSSGTVGTLQQVTRISDGSPLYPLADLSPLLQ